MNMLVHAAEEQLSIDLPTEYVNFTRFFPLLQTALERLSCLPIRDLKDWQKLRSTFSQQLVLLMDGSELPVQRPDNEQQQKQAFSGKKKDTPERYS